MAINRKNDISLKWANALGDLTQKKLAAEKPKGPGWVTFKELKEITDIGEEKAERPGPLKFLPERPRGLTE